MEKEEKIGALQGITQEERAQKHKITPKNKINIL